MNITKFKTGDSITRIIPNKNYGNDLSYIGDKLIFLYCDNSSIYLQRTSEMDILIFKDSPLVLEIDSWNNGWNYYDNFNESDKNFEYSIKFFRLRNTFEEDPIAVII